MALLSNKPTVIDEKAIKIILSIIFLAGDGAFFINAIINHQGIEFYGLYLAGILAVGIPLILSRGYSK